MRRRPPDDLRVMAHDNRPLLAVGALLGLSLLIAELVRAIRIQLIEGHFLLEPPGHRPFRARELAPAGATTSRDVLAVLVVLPMFRQHDLSFRPALLRLFYQLILLFSKRFE